MVWSGCRASAKTPIPAAATDSAGAEAGQADSGLCRRLLLGHAVGLRAGQRRASTTTVGYAGGSAQTATYDQVTTETTGHAESVKVVYDPSKITYGQLLRIFFSVAHDPTQLNRQGPDVGTSYRSAIFYTNDEQRQHQPGLHCAARRRARLSQPDRHRGDAAEGLLRRRELPSALRRQQSQTIPTSWSATAPRSRRSRSSSPSCSWITRAGKSRFSLSPASALLPRSEATT